jgi:GMP synthase-like glutamine amidotransferase
LPSVADFDALIAMGGPMSVNEEVIYPWLVEEKHLLRGAVQAGKPVLGVCLGAQLMASSLGASVYPNAEKEIGWLPVEGVASTEPGYFSFPPSLLAFHWHGETFDLPPGARLLARSAGCANQAFQVGRRAIGLQFHLETTPESARLLVENCGGDLVEGRFVQDGEALLADRAEAYGSMAALLDRLLDYLLG